MGRGEDGMTTLFSRTTLAHAVSGSVGSIIAMALTYPLDRVRTIKQLQKSQYDTNQGTVAMVQAILQKEGWKGLYQGLQPMLVALGASNFVYFYWFTALKAIFQYALRRSRPKGVLSSDSPIGNLVLASVAGTLNVLMTTPVWVAYTKLAIQGMAEMRGEVSKSEEGRYTGVWDAMKKIAARDGVSTLWSGMGPSLILVSNPSVQFASYEWLKRALLKFHLKSEPAVKDYTHFADVMEDQTDNVVSEAITGPSLSSFEYLFLGAFAKMIATVATYPIQIAQTRMRAEAQGRRASNSSNNSSVGVSVDEPEGKGQGRKVITIQQQPKPYTSTLDCLMRIYNSEGVAGLYRGMEAKLLQTCLTSAFMFAAYEQISALILRFILWQKFSTKLQ